jgi:hypothetical protein
LSKTEPPLWTLRLLIRSGPCFRREHIRTGVVAD